MHSADLSHINDCTTQRGNDINQHEYLSYCVRLQTAHLSQKHQREIGKQNYAGTRCVFAIIEL